MSSYVYPAVLLAIPHISRIPSNQHRPAKRFGSSGSDGLREPGILAKCGLLGGFASSGAFCVLSLPSLGVPQAPVRCRVVVCADRCVLGPRAEKTGGICEGRRVPVARWHRRSVHEEPRRAEPESRWRIAFAEGVSDAPRPSRFGQEGERRDEAGVAECLPCAWEGREAERTPGGRADDRVFVPNNGAERAGVTRLSAGVSGV